jgi:hypothetical protein
MRYGVILWGELKDDGYMESAVGLQGSLVELLVDHSVLPS